MNRIIHWSCFSCNIKNGEVEYRDWESLKDQAGIVVRGIRVEHHRISWDCKNPDILVRDENQEIPFWKLERIVEGFKT